MTATAIAPRHLAAASRIGPVKAWRIERIKIRRSWFLGGAVVLSAFAQLLGVWNYTTNLPEFQAQGVTWLAIWVQGAILVTSIFLPLLHIVILAQGEALEHQTRGWQRLASIDRSTSAVAGKMLVALELALLGMAVYLSAAIVSGLLIGFNPAELPPYVLRALCGVLGAWAVGAVTLMLSTWFQNFATIASVGLGATILGLGLTAVAPPVAALSPFTLMTSTLGGRSVENFSSPSDMFSTVVVSLLWTIVSTWVMRMRIRRREW